VRPEFYLAQNSPEQDLSQLYVGAQDNSCKLIKSPDDYLVISNKNSFFLIRFLILKEREEKYAHISQIAKRLHRQYTFLFCRE
jgi:hypothetical protein